MIKFAWRDWILWFYTNNIIWRYSMNWEFTVKIFNLNQYRSNWLLCGWYSLVLVVYLQQYRPSGSKNIWYENSCASFNSEHNLFSSFTITSQPFFNIKLEPAIVLSFWYTMTLIRKFPFRWHNLSNVFSFKAQSNTLYPYFNILHRVHRVIGHSILKMSVYHVLTIYRSQITPNYKLYVCSSTTHL